MIVAVLVFAFVMTMNVAFADYRCNFCHNDNDECKCPAITVSSSNNGSIFNTTSATALTGKNIATASGFFGKAGVISGAAVAASNVTNQVGSNETKIEGAKGPVTVTSSNDGSIMNWTASSAKTGMNWASAKCGSAGVISGAATAGSTVMNVIGFNSTIIK